jgi:hypothetical protein
MALSVAAIAGFPAANSTYQESAGTPVVAAYHSFTSGVYTVSGTVYVAGYLDGEERGRVFYANNDTGTAGVSPEIGLPTLISITQLSQVDNLGNTQYGGYKIVLDFGANSSDYSSPMNLFLDQNAMLIIASTQYG